MAAISCFSCGSFSGRSGGGACLGCRWRSGNNGARLDGLRDRRYREQLEDGHLIIARRTEALQYDEWYSSINTWPSKIWYRGQGLRLRDLLQAAGGLREEATLIRFTSADGFQVTFTVRELLEEPAYRFPNFMDTGLAGHLPGDTRGAVPVEPIIAHRSFSAHSKEEIRDGRRFTSADANHLLFGQRG